MFKRILSLVLVFVLAFSFLSASAFADDEGCELTDKQQELLEAVRKALDDPALEWEDILEIVCGAAATDDMWTALSKNLGLTMSELIYYFGLENAKAPGEELKLWYGDASKGEKLEVAAQADPDRTPAAVIAAEQYYSVNYSANSAASAVGPSKPNHPEPEEDASLTHLEAAASSDTDLAAAGIAEENNGFFALKLFKDEACTQETEFESGVFSYFSKFVKNMWVNFCAFASGDASVTEAESNTTYVYDAPKDCYSTGSGGTQTHNQLITSDEAVLSDARAQAEEVRANALEAVEKAKDSKEKADKAGVIKGLDEDVEAAKLRAELVREEAKAMDAAFDKAGLQTRAKDMQERAKALAQSTAGFDDMVAEMKDTINARLEEDKENPFKESKSTYDGLDDKGNIIKVEAVTKYKSFTLPDGRECRYSQIWENGELAITNWRISSDSGEALHSSENFGSTMSYSSIDYNSAAGESYSIQKTDSYTSISRNSTETDGDDPDRSVNTSLSITNYQNGMSSAYESKTLCISEYQDGMLIGFRYEDMGRLQADESETASLGELRKTLSYAETSPVRDTDGNITGFDTLRTDTATQYRCEGEGANAARVEMWTDESSRKSTSATDELGLTLGKEQESISYTLTTYADGNTRESATKSTTDDAGVKTTTDFNAGTSGADYEQYSVYEQKGHYEGDMYITDGSVDYTRNTSKDQEYTYESASKSQNVDGEMLSAGYNSDSFSGVYTTVREQSANDYISAEIDQNGNIVSASDSNASYYEYYNGAETVHNYSDSVKNEGDNTDTLRTSSDFDGAPVLETTTYTADGSNANSALSSVAELEANQDGGVEIYTNICSEGDNVSFTVEEEVGGEVKTNTYTVTFSKEVPAE